MDRRLAHRGADGGEFRFRVGDGLPQLGSAAVSLVHLPPVDLQALLLELEQYPVPRGIRLPDLIPDNLSTRKSRAIRPAGRNKPLRRSNRRGSGAHLKLVHEGPADRLHLKELVADAAGPAASSRCEFTHQPAVAWSGRRGARRRRPRGIGRRRRRDWGA